MDSGPSTDQWLIVGSASSLDAKTKLHLGGRQVVLLRLRKRGSSDTKWTCMDAVCYHMGGPLHEGKLVSAGGRTCIKCPWHGYLFDVLTGEGWYMETPSRYKSKGPRQRIHEVQLRADGNVYIRLSNTSESYASDEYATRSVHGEST